VTRSAPPVYVRADDPQALADAFREAHEAHGATAHQCRDVQASSPLCFHAECPTCGVDLFLVIED
jgi:hypothetical protein